MHKIEIPDIGFVKEIPSAMEEMTREQFIYFAVQLLKLFDRKITIQDLKVAMAIFLLGTEKYDANQLRKIAVREKMEIAENVFRITELLNYFFVEEDGKYKVNLGFTKNFVPTVKIGSKTYYGPQDALTDVDLLEYKDAGNYYRAYMSTGDEKELNRMMAVLYRVKKGAGKNARYKPEDLERRAEKMGKLDFAIRFSVYVFFMACEEFLRTAEMDIDGNAVSFSLLYEQTLKEKQLAQKQKYEDKTGLAGVAFALAESGVFGAIEKVYRQNLYDVLLLMYRNRVNYLNQLENS